ncbi:putative diaminohydroxyphosphoribosylaminopyrimidine deaminase [Dioscorea sansibarensis]
MASSLASPAHTTRTLFPLLPSKPQPPIAINGHTRPSGAQISSGNPRRFIGVRCQVMDDTRFMRRCVELARRAIGCTSPNPMVGCVIVKDGAIVGEGFHPKAGQPHAEVFAVRDAGALAENATAYVSLEPCNHYGRTPPCTEALIGAKLKRVVIGMVDPNPIVASKGVERLRDAGMEVVVGVEELMCRKLNEAYIHKMLTGKPFVTLRYSLSFNGRILNHLGEGAEESGGYCSQLLQEYDGVIISSDSLSKISELPRSKETGANQPLIIVIARNNASLVCLPSLTTGTKILILSERAINVQPKSEEVENVVIQKLNLSAILDYCATLGLCSILFDFRADDAFLTKLLEDSFEERLLQKVVMEVSPVWNVTGEPCMLNFGSQSLKLKDLQSRLSNDSVIAEGYIV